MKDTGKPPRNSAVVEPWLVAAAVALLTTCWLIPAEGVFAGETGWRNLLWLCLACGWTFVPEPRRDAASVPRSWRWGVRGAVLLVAGHVLSGSLVLVTSGQKRFAANLLLEWLGIAAGWWVWSRILWNPRWRAAVPLPCLVTALCLAGYGIWQATVELPAMAREYGPAIVQVRTGTATPELMARLTAAGIPVTEPGLTLFEKRLIDSREPFGLFALANTFGGMLATSLIWLAGGLLVRNFPLTPSQSPQRRHSIASMAVSGGSLLLLVWTLLLTKSRTAVVGVLAGGLVLLTGWGLVRLRQRVSQPGTWRRGLVWGAAIVVVLAVVPLGLVQSGVWDAEVLQEAPKSLQFRWNYWVASGRLIAESPVLGVGLGQFQSSYLRVKVPEASEEILDPHQMFLEAWLNGGVLAFLGLCLIGAACCLSVGEWWTRATTVGFVPSPPDLQNFTNRNDRWAVVLGSIAGFGLVFVWNFAAGSWDDQPLVLGVVWLAVWWLVSRVFPVELGLDSALGSFLPALAALVCGVMHLQGAGGFEMGGVLAWIGMFGLMSLSYGLPLPAATDPSDRPDQQKLWRQRGVLAVAVVLGVGILWPDVQCRAALNAAVRQFGAGRTGPGTASLERAAALDPWNPQPWQQLADVRSRAPADQPRGSSVDITSALEALDEAQRRDPRNPQLWNQRGELLQRAGMGTAAVEAFREAHIRYPTNAMIAYRLADAAYAAGAREEAASVARRGLAQDAINRQQGHVERWLPDAIAQQLEAWAQVSHQQP